MKLILYISWVMFVLFVSIAALGRTGNYIDMLTIIGVAMVTYTYAYEFGKVRRGDD